jgi:hypothetical protein
MGLRDWAAAEKWLKTTVEACPPHSGAWDELGLALEMQGRAAEARAAYQKAVVGLFEIPTALSHLTSAGGFVWDNEEWSIADIFVDFLCSYLRRFGP